MNHISQPINFADRPLTVAARRSLGLRDDFFGSIQIQSGESLWRYMAQAMEAGDRTSIRRIAGTYLLHPMHVPLGIGRDRLILMAASAHADYIDVKFLKDLIPYLNAVRAEIDLVRLNDATYGLRPEGALDNPFEKAEARINETIAHVQQLMNGNRYVTAYVVMGIAYLGDLPIVDAISDAMVEFNVSDEAPAVLGARYRHLHGRPELAVAHVQKHLNKYGHAWLENNMCASLCDMDEVDAGLVHACRSLSLMTFGDTPKERKSRLYTWRTIYRPLRLLGYNGPLRLSQMVISANEEDESAEDELTSGYQSAIAAALILKSLGMPELSRRVTRQIAAISEPWVAEVLVRIDAQEPVANVEEIAGRLRVVRVGQ
jgi:hypothetical protein